MLGNELASKSNIQEEEEEQEIGHEYHDASFSFAIINDENNDKKDKQVFIDERYLKKESLPYFPIFANSKTFIPNSSQTSSPILDMTHHNTNDTHDNLSHVKKAVRFQFFASRPSDEKVCKQPKQQHYHHDHQKVNLKKELFSSIDDQPPLNVLTTTPYNFSRMVVRLGPLVQLIDFLYRLILWEESMKSFTFLLSFICICLYPSLILIVPSCTIIFIILNHYDESKINQKSTLKTQHSDTKNHGNTINTRHTNSKHNHDDKSSTKNKKKKRTLSQTTYLRNLQFIQNQMGQFNLIMDNFNASKSLIDWSDKEITENILKSAVISLPLILIVNWIVSINYVVLAVGCMGFLYSTRIGQFVLKWFSKWDMNWGVRSLVFEVVGGNHDSNEHHVNLKKGIIEGGWPLALFWSWMNRPHHVPLKVVDTVLIEVFENQRWWAGRGWLSLFLKSDPGPWSDESGNINKPAKPDHVPFNCRWKDDEWILDKQWENTDEEGWVYSDNHWKNKKPFPSLLSFTRRRKWLRRMEELELDEDEDDA